MEAAKKAHEASDTDDSDDGGVTTESEAETDEDGEDQSAETGEVPTNVFAKLLSTNTWICPTCEVPNPMESAKCQCCETPNPDAAPAEATAGIYNSVIRFSLDSFCSHVASQCHDIISTSTRKYQSLLVFYNS